MVGARGRPLSRREAQTGGREARRKDRGISGSGRSKGREIQEVQMGVREAVRREISVEGLRERELGVWEMGQPFLLSFSQLSW